MQINWKVRVKNVTFWMGLLGVIASPVLAYFGAAPQDLTTWDSVGQMIVNTISNPFLVFSILTAVLAFLGVSTDPTTKGLSDSDQAMTYTEPKA